MASQSAQGPSTHDEVHEYQVNEMWSEYLNNVDDYDKNLTDGWKDDANGVLVFTGLFSAIVASFIIESYKLLSPDPASQSVFLLGQLSQQFSGFANGTYVQPQSYPSSPPSVSIICVNILWLLSLLLSITSALFATLMLQWARTYLDLPQTRSIPKERARVRSVLFFGMEKYRDRMHLAVETAPTLLHLSVFLFFIGLVVFFFTIFKTVAVVILISVGFFGLAYFALTILPCLDHSSPYRTPMSSLWWHLWHTSLSYVAGYLHLILRTILIQLYNFLVPPNLGDVTTSTLSFRLTRWLQRIGDFGEKHGMRLKHGFRATVLEHAREASQDIDIEALTWLFQLPALTEKSKIQKFVASLPGETIIQLLSKSFQDGRVTFRHHLSTLFRSCTPGTASSELDENMRRRRLLVCLDTVLQIAKASVASPLASSSLLNEMRLHFANIVLMRPLWADKDPAIRVTARSICALFARQLLHQRQLGVEELIWLQEVMDKPSNTIFNEHNNRARVDSMNADAFVYGVLSYQSDDLPNALAISFKDTLTILMNTNSRTSVHTDTFEEWLSDHIRRRIEQENDRQDPGRDNVIDQLRRMSDVVY